MPADDRQALVGHSESDAYVPLHIHHGSHVVQEAWKRGYDWVSTRNVQRLQEQGILRAWPIGWWLRGVGYCPTDGVLFYALKRRGYLKIYVDSSGHKNEAER